MYITNSILNRAYKNAKPICINSGSKLVFFSDMHKGDNSYADDFAHNVKIYKTALQHYYQNNFTYFELGDGVELWENKSFEPIYHSYKDIFGLQLKFHQKNRLYLLWGNHDMIFKDKNVVEKILNRFFTDKQSKAKKVLFDVKFNESIILEIDGTDKTILLIHGHQADCMNYVFWKFNRFLVRYLWCPLQKTFALKDPTSPAKNHKTLLRVEKKIKKWMLKNNNQIVIAGHTHRPRFPQPKELPYFNDGSCVHPKSIIGIEIINLEISLVKWYFKDTVVTKQVLEGPMPIEMYF